MLWEERFIVPLMFDVATFVALDFGHSAILASFASTFSQSGNKFEQHTAGDVRQLQNVYRQGVVAARLMTPLI